MTDQKTRDEEKIDSQSNESEAAMNNEAEPSTGDKNQADEADSVDQSPESLLADNEEKLQSTIDRLQRLQADFENYKKRVARDNVDLMKQVENRIYCEILTIYDNFDRAFETFESSDDKDAFIEGAEKIFAQFQELLKKANIETIEAAGAQFDPSCHEALLMVESEETEPNRVLEVFERGFRREDSILRPSRVTVSKQAVAPTIDVESDEQSDQISEKRGED